MTTDDIIRKAKERLAELDAERAKLQAIIAAAEGKPELPAPNPLPFIPVMPQPMPYMPQRDGIYDGSGPISCVSIPAGTIRGFVAGGTCIDTSSLVFRT